MGNMTITNLDTGSVLLKGAQFQDDVLQVAAADTIAEGTVLARKSVVDAVTAVTGSNTGTGTLTLVTVAAGQIVPVAGDYVVTFTAAVSNGGVFKIVDPNGLEVASGLSLTVGATSVTAFEAAGLAFTITNTATNFIIGDLFTLTVVADGDLVPFATAGAGGAQIPLAILTYDVVTTDAADVPVRVGIAGSYRKERLVLDADGDASNVTAAVIDQLRHFGLIATNVTELNDLDNQ